MSDEDCMERTKYFLNFVVLITILIVSSCGKDNSTVKKAGNSSTSESLVGKECSCDSTYMPVSGINSYGATVTYDNICLANCHGLSGIVQGQYPCRDSLEVCLDNGYNGSLPPMTECKAQVAIRNGYAKSIIKFKSCY